MSSVPSGLRTGGTGDCNTSIRCGVIAAGAAVRTGSFENLEVAPNAERKREFIVSMLQRADEQIMKGSDRGTYNHGIETRGIGSCDDGVVEIVGVALILILQLVEKVEEIEGERRRRTDDRRREPTDTEKLNVLGNIISKPAAATVPDNEAVDSGEVEHHKILKRRGVRTCFIHIVSKLQDEAESG